MELARFVLVVLLLLVGCNQRPPSTGVPAKTPARKAPAPPPVVEDQSQRLETVFPVPQGDPNEGSTRWQVIAADGSSRIGISLDQVSQGLNGPANIWGRSRTVGQQGVLLLSDRQWAYVSRSEEMWFAPLADKVEGVTNLGESLFAINTGPRSDAKIRMGGIPIGRSAVCPDLVFDPYGLWQPPPGVIPRGFLYEDRILVSRGGKFGFANRRGEIVVDIVYNFAQHYSDGLAAVLRGNQWGYVDRAGEMKIEPQFDWAYHFDEDVALTLLRSSSYESSYELIDKAGNAIRPVSDIGNSLLSEGLSLGMEDGLFGYANTQGQWVIPPKYESAGAFVDGLAFVVHPDPENSGAIDQAGNRKIALPNLKRPTYFHGGLAWVEFKDGTAGYINRDGQWVWQTAN